MKDIKKNHMENCSFSEDVFIEMTSSEGTQKIIHLLCMYQMMRKVLYPSQDEHSFISDYTLNGDNSQYNQDPDGLSIDTLNASILGQNPINPDKLDLNT